VKRQNRQRRVSIGRAIAATLCGVLFNSAIAADSAPEGVPAAGFEPMATGKLLQMGFGLFLVLALILATAWFARRMGRFQGGTGSSLRIIGGLSMGARERVVLIQAGTTQLLLGVAPGRIQTLHVLPEAVAVDAADEVAGASFASGLSAILNRRHGT
jgi:flagellar protein FliO/FliZ